MRDPHTLALAVAAVNATSKAAVARAIGKSRTAVSLYIDDKYPADPGEIEAAIRSRYDRYPCPHTGQEIGGPECSQRASQPRPFGGRAKKAHWEACQACQHKNLKEPSCKPK